MDRGGFLRAVALGGLAVATTGILALHVLRPDLHPGLHYMSEYAAGPYSWVMGIVFVSLGVGSAAVAVQVARNHPRTRLAAPAAVFLVVWSGAMAALAVFPGTPSTPAATAVVHLALLRAAEAALVAAALLLLVAARQKGEGGLGFAALTVTFGVVAAVAHGLTEVLGVVPWVGLAQRTAGAVTVAWLALVGSEARRWCRK